MESFTYISWLIPSLLRLLIYIIKSDIYYNVKRVGNKSNKWPSLKYKNYAKYWQLWKDYHFLKW